jgi:hypothetical protein
LPDFGKSWQIRNGLNAPLSPHRNPQTVWKTRTALTIVLFVDFSGLGNG